MSQLKLFDRKQERSKRDMALNLFETFRGDLLAAARAVADELAEKNGRVTAPDVLAVLRDRGLGDALDEVDRRFMGAVFRAGTGWKRIGWEPGGSHGRPVSIWARSEKRVG